MPKTKPKNKTSKVKKLSAIKPKKRIGFGLVALITLIVAGVGAYLLFFASAYSNNCQAEGDLRICDINQVIKADGTDALLSWNGEAEALGNQRWGTYFGAAFRAPSSAYKGAEPMYRLYSPTLSMHTVKFGPEANQTLSNPAIQTINEGVYFYAWRNNPNLPGVVPVYRVTGTGWLFIDVFVASPDIYNQLRGDTKAWQDAGIAFWAYPEGYAIPGQSNPYACHLVENFTSERCSGARQEVIKKVTEEAKQSAADPGNKPATGSPSSLGSPQSATPTNGSSPAATTPSGGTPAEIPQDCSAPNPSQATKDACLKKLVEYYNKQPASAKAESVAVATIPQPSGVQDCSAPNPSDLTKEYCRGRYWGSAAQNGTALPGDLPNCSAPNPSELVAAFCQGQFYGAVTQSKYNQQKAKDEADMAAAAEARAAAKTEADRKKIEADYLKILSVIDAQCRMFDLVANPKNLQCIAEYSGGQNSGAAIAQKWTCRNVVKQWYQPDKTKTVTSWVIVNGYSDAVKWCTTYAKEKHGSSWVSTTVI